MMVMLMDWCVNPLHWSERQLDMYYVAYGPYRKVKVEVLGSHVTAEGLTVFNVKDYFVEI